MTEIKEERTLKDVILLHEKFEIRTDKKEKDVNLGNLIKKEWLV